MAVKDKILKFLSSGKTLTTAQARFQYGIKNVSARIHELRTEGHPIYTNNRTLKDGRKTSEYRLGTPKKSRVARTTKAK